MPGVVWTVLPLAVAAFVVYHALEAYKTYSKLSHFKGPPLAAWTSLWLAKQAVSANMPTAQKEALRQYGTRNKHQCKRGPDRVWELFN